MDGYVNIFGEPVDVSENKRRKGPIPRGYIAPPGSGPDGHFCRDCRHKTNNRRFLKCALVKMTKGAGTDIRAKSPACSRWEARD